MSEEPSSHQRLVRLADQLRQTPAEADLKATLEVAGDVLEGGDAATAARMLLDRGEEGLGEHTWQEVAAALLAEQQARAEEPTADPRTDGDAAVSDPTGPASTAADAAERPSAAAAEHAARETDAGGASDAAVAGPDRDAGVDDPLAAALREFAAELETAASARAAGDLDARTALARLKEGFHATRRTLAATQRDELRARMARPR